VTATNSVGESARSDEQAVAIAVTVPGAPVLSATAGVSSVSLSWTLPANGGSAITGYNVYRGTASGAETLMTSVGATTTSYTDTATATGTTYYYEVTATSGVGEGARSNEKSATVAATVPGAPVLLVTTGTSSASLFWSTPSSGGSALTGYNVYRATTSGAETLLASVGATTISYSDTATAPGATYYYEVTATNSVGESARSDEQAAAMAATVPGAPVLSATAGTNSTVLTWTTPGTGGSAITGFNVYRGTASGAETLLASVGPTTTTYADTGIAPGTTDYYEVTAVNGVGESARSNEKAATVAATAPIAPVLVVTTGTSSASLFWSTPANGGSAITGYNVYRGTAPGAETLLAGVSATTTSYSDAGLAPGTTDYYEVTAVNGVGESAPSNEQAGTIAATAPSAPVLSASIGASSVSLSWTTPANGGSPLIGYNVYRGSLSGAETLLASVGPTTTTYNDAGLAPGTTHYYEVTAVNGVGESAPSNEQAGTIAATVPSAPVLSATAGTNSVSLTWTTPANGGSALTGYNVYRGTASGAETMLARVGVTASYTDTAMAPGTTEYYEVTAVNGVGNSATSNEKSAAMGGTVPGAPTLSLTGGADSVGLSWSTPPNGGLALTGFKVYRGSSSGRETLLVAVGPATTGYTNSGLVPGTTYYYEVTATNSVGEGARSTERSITIRRYRYLYRLK
jgi:fibronectin type 3 domain-containing protein